MDAQMATLRGVSTFNLPVTPSTLRSSLDDPTVKAEYAGKADNHITFLHPGYSDLYKESVLLRLQAFDRDGGGLHFGTALAACRIVAGNSQTGFFTHQRDGSKIDLQYDELLRESKYYFYNPDVENEMYPVYRSFADWRFPHDNFPHEWSIVNEDSENDRAPPSASSLTAFVSARDGCCRVSERRGADYFTRAHLIPRSEKDWFHTNRMEEYNLNPQLSKDWMLNDVRNAIALRSDIHLAFDDRKFVIVPKQSKWVVQFLGQTNNLGHEFHNTHIRLKGVSPQFLYARFAWTIFPLLSSFLYAHVPRELLVRLPNRQEASKVFTFEELKADFTSRRRSASPKKRQMTNVEGEQLTEKRICQENGLDKSQVENSYTALSLPSVCSTDTPTQPTLSREDWIRLQRPTDPSLYCCNYEKAESDARAGIPGKAIWGGAYLCDQCLGIEYLEDRDKDVPVVSWDD